MKKIIALFLAISALISFAVVPAFGAEENGNMGFLQAFDFVNVAEGEELSGDTPIRRIELAEIFYNIIFPDQQIPEEYIGGASFADVSENQKHIAATMYGMDIMKGYGNGTFAPDEIITYTQAVKAMVSFLGYNTYADRLGGYPGGYLAQATRLQILPGGNISGDAPATYGMVATMLKKALGADIAIWNNTTTDGAATLDVLEGVNYLKYYRSVYVAKGMILGNYLTSIKNEASTDYFAINIGGHIMNVAEGAHGIQELLGHSVHVYYTQDKNSKEIVYYEEDVNNTLEISAENIAVVSNGNIKYYVDGVDTALSADFATNASMIYNGTYETSYSINDINPFAAGNLDGSVKLIDNTNDGIYDILVVTAYQPIVVNDVRNNKIYGKYNDTDKVIDLTHYKERNINIRNYKGGAVEISEIKAGYIISICRDKNSVVKDIIVTKDVLKGTIEEISYTGEKVSSIKLNGMLFPVSNSAEIIDTAGRMAPGVTAEVFFGNNAKIVVIDVDGQYVSSYKKGYLIDAAVTGGLQKTAAVMIFSADGEMKTYDLSERVIFNASPTDADAVINAFGTVGRRVKRQVILYKTDAEDKTITAIELATKLQDGDKAFDGFYEYPGDMFYYVGGFKTFNYKYVANTDTIAFGVPSEEERDQYDLYNMIELPTGEGNNYGKDTSPVSMQLYGTKKNGMVVDIAVVNDTSGSTGDTSRRPFFIVSQVSTVIGDDGEENIKISGTYVKGVTTATGSFMVNSEIFAAGHNMGVSGDANNGKKPFINQSETRFTPGDVLRVNDFTVTGDKISRIDITQFYQIYDYEDNAFMAPSGYSFPETAVHYVYGKVVDRDGSTIMIQLPDNSFRTFDLSAGKYCFMEVTKNPQTGEAKIKGSNYESILSEATHPGEASRVVIHYRGSGIGCFVYNDGR